MLDPASATVAFVGFAASIAALIAVISDSAQTVHTLYYNLRDAPEELSDLKRIVEGNEALLKNIFIVGQRYETGGIPRDLYECWDKAAKHVLEDLQKFKIEIDKIFNVFNASSYSKRHLRRRIRQLFSAHAIEGHCKKLLAHKVDLNVILSLMQNAQTYELGNHVIMAHKDISEELRREPLARLSQVRHEFAISREEMITAVKSEFGRLLSQDAIAQALKRTLPPGTSAPALHASPVPFPAQNELASVGRSITLVFQPVYWSIREYKFPIGTLRIEQAEGVEGRVYSSTPASYHQKSSSLKQTRKVKFRFNPPPWFSNWVVEIGIINRWTGYNSFPQISWCRVPSGMLTDISVREDANLKELPLDLQLSLVAQSEAFQLMFENIVYHCMKDKAVVEYNDSDDPTVCLTKALGQGHITISQVGVAGKFLSEIFSHMAGWYIEEDTTLHFDWEWLSSSEPSDLALLKRRHPRFDDEYPWAVEFSHDCLAAGASLPKHIDMATILMGPIGYAYIVEICSVFDITLLDDFRRWDQWLLASIIRTVPAVYRNFQRQAEAFPGDMLQHYVSLESQVGEINSAEESLRHRFLLSLSSGGTTAMLEPLLASGLHLGRRATYYFEWASIKRNIDVALCLLDYGAEPSLEFVIDFCRHDHRDVLASRRQSKHFPRLLQRLLEAVSPLRNIHISSELWYGLVRIFTHATIMSEPDRTWKVSKFYASNCVDTVRVLLEAGLLHNSRLPRTPTHVANIKHGGWARSGLILAIDLQSYDVVDLLLKHGHDVEETGYSGNTPLRYAVELGLADHVRVLLDHDASVMSMTSEGRTIWQFAAMLHSQSHRRAVGPKTKRYSCRWPALELVELEEDDRVMSMICVQLKNLHDIDFQQLLKHDREEIKTHSPDLPSGWRKVELVGSQNETTLRVARAAYVYRWQGVWFPGYTEIETMERTTWLCPCVDCVPTFHSKGHTSLPDGWERQVKPCSCDVPHYHHDPEVTYIDERGYRKLKPCALSNGSMDTFTCKLRVSYFNSQTRETSTLCPWTNCWQERCGVSVITLSDLLGDETDDLGDPDEVGSPLITAQEPQGSAVTCAIELDSQFWINLNAPKIGSNNKNLDHWPAMSLHANINKLTKQTHWSRIRQTWRTMASTIVRRYVQTSVSQHQNLEVTKGEIIEVAIGLSAIVTLYAVYEVWSAGSFILRTMTLHRTYLKLATLAMVVGLLWNHATHQ